MKQTSRPVPDFQAFGLATCARRSGPQERPCHRLHRFRAPRGSQHPPRSSPPGGCSFRGSPWGCPQRPPAPGSGQRLGETGTLQVLEVQLWPCGRRAGTGLRTDSPASAPDGPAHPPRFTLAPTPRAGSTEVGLTLPPLPPTLQGALARSWPVTPSSAAGRRPTAGPRGLQLGRFTRCALNWTHQPARS